ncbi:uncharacterized protein B0T23DRAFT_163982 [Neurospora hispaniola]|uniref:Uncharacterized protein n=1 Tax=Neurospora hispaniola TaxID=588809 RepID=A0AAJ0MQC4_9PEZI|nr:hypothetical protein B0T23DRAFT_163982 [Neurospora hispaniola]
MLDQIVIAQRCTVILHVFSSSNVSMFLTSLQDLSMFLSLHQCPTSTTSYHHQCWSISIILAYVICIPVFINTSS